MEQLGDTNIYEVQTDSSNKNVIVVRADIKYKIAFAGMIKKSLFSMSEADEIFSENYPPKSGIWIENNSRNEFLDILDNSGLFNSAYNIDESGYLILKNKDNINNNDEILQNAIDSNNQYIISISSTCYIIDDITGEIMDYCYEKMDNYQTYEYFENENNKLIFITENKENKLTEKEIIDSVISLF